MNNLIVGIHVEGDTVIIKTKDNDSARELCNEILRQNDSMKGSGGGRGISAKDDWKRTREYCS